MTAPWFTSNPSDYSDLEGLYITEQNPPATVVGVNLNTVGVCGETVRGPVNKPILISSEQRFRDIFGGRDQTQNGTGGAIVSKVWQALLNKPFGSLYVVRAAAAAAAAATHTFSDVVPTQILKVDAANVGTWGNSVTIDIANASDGNANHFNLTVHYLGQSVTYVNLDVSGSNDNTLAIVGSDDANLVKLTKLASGRPLNATGTALTTGSDGTIADSDFTATGGPMEQLAGLAGVSVVWVAERSSSALRTKWSTLAASAVDRLFLVCPDDQTVSASTAETGAPAYNSDRVIYTFNHAYTLDPATATEVLTDPCSWMASILSQSDVDENPGRYESTQYTKGITRLYNETYLRADYKALKAAGIAALEKDGGFKFVSGISTYVPDGTGKEQITRRRSADYLQLSLAGVLKYSVKEKNTQSRRDANKGLVTGFLNDLKNAQRIVQDFQVDTEKLNTQAQRDAGIEKILVRVKLIGHILAMVLVTQIGDTVNITQAA